MEVFFQHYFCSGGVCWVSKINPLPLCWVRIHGSHKDKSTAYIGPVGLGPPAGVGQKEKKSKDGS